MHIDVVTIFPGICSPILEESILKRAQQKKKLTVKLHDLRRYACDKHRTVDDRPYGGGAGMVMRPEPFFRAVEAIRKARAGKKGRPRVILLSPQGAPFSQKTARRLVSCRHLILLCGRYEGVDERVREELADEEISIGDYVLTGGELPAMVLIDAVSRLIPGVLGDKNSLNFESFEDNLLEYPHYTRPASWRGMDVPAVLVSGDHARIEAWRQRQALERTKKRRPDLWRLRHCEKKNKRGVCP